MGPANYEKASSLMGAVTARVREDPESFHAFVAILEGEPALNAVVKDLLEKYGTVEPLVSDRHSSHSAQLEDQDGPWFHEKKCCSKKLHVDGQQRMRVKELDKELRRTQDELRRVREEERQLREECESKEIQLGELEEQKRMMEEELRKARQELREERERWEREMELLRQEYESWVVQHKEDAMRDMEHLTQHISLYQKHCEEQALRRLSSSSSLASFHEAWDSSRHVSPTGSVYSLYAASSPKWRGSTQSLQHSPMFHSDPPHCNEPEQGHGANERIADTSLRMERCSKPQEEQQQWLKRVIPARWYPAMLHPAKWYPARWYPARWYPARWYPARWYAARERNDA